MKDVTAIVISFLRPDYTIACIQSLRETYPEIQILVGENGTYDEKLAAHARGVGAKYIQLEYDSGVGKARNRLIEQIQTPYVLVGDDDFYYDKGANVDRMADFLRLHPEYDVIGGRIIQDGEIKNYQGYIQKIGDHFITTAVPEETDIEKYNRDHETRLRYTRADLVFNFFVARTDVVKNVPWDEEIKVAYEHYSWFYDLKVYGGNVAYTPDALVIHKPAHIRAKVEQTEVHGLYKEYRNRKQDKQRFFAKYGVRYTIGMNGTKTYAPDHIQEVRRYHVKYVDFCITTFKRRSALERLLYSIAEYYPNANIYIADQNERLDREYYKDLRVRLAQAGMQKRFSVESLPYDSGLSYARNHLVTTTPNQYKLILDDDMVFTAETDIRKMVELLEGHPNAAIVGGRVQQLGYDIHFEFNLEKKGDVLYQVPDGDNYKKYKGIRYKKTGCVLNFALIRKELFHNIQWDPEQKVTEHMDFYLRLQNIVTHILYVPEVVIDHPPAPKDETYGDYKYYRQRAEYTVRMMKKHGLKQIRYLNGQVTELQPDNSLKKYRIK